MYLKDWTTSRTNERTLISNKHVYPISSRSDDLILCNDDDDDDGDGDDDYDDDNDNWQE